MIESVKILTNNPLVQDKLKNEYTVEFLDCDHEGTLIKARDQIHLGYRLLSHPLSGSVKPNETPYKSLILSSEPSKAADVNSVILIEEAIATGRKLSPRVRELTDKVLYDFQTVDLALLMGALQ